MVVSNVAIYGKKQLLCILISFIISGSFFLRFLMQYKQDDGEEDFWGIVPIFLFSAFFLLFLLKILVGKKKINCYNEIISIKSSFSLKKERKITLPKNSRLLLQCEESARFERCDIFCSRINMPVTSIYYVIKTMPAGEPILRFCEKQAALETFNYICQRFSHVDKTIDFSNEKSILKVRKLLWIAIWKNLLLFASIQTCFASFILFFCSYCIYSGSYSIYADDWKLCHIYVENEYTEGDYVWIQTAKQTKKLKCRVLNSDLSALREAAKIKKPIKAYIAFDKSPELRLTAPELTNFELFLSIAGGMLFISATLFSLFLRMRKKLRFEASVADWGNAASSSVFEE